MRSCSSVRSSHVNLHLPDADIIPPDKYSQIYRILLPICNTLSQLPTLYKSPALRAYIDAEYGSLDALYLEVLGDFFRHAFDGSGADNFYDAGSCIDGRLTSAWNWCSSLEKKRYFHVFLLTGTLPDPVPSDLQFFFAHLFYAQGSTGSTASGRRTEFISKTDGITSRRNAGYSSNHSSHNLDIKRILDLSSSLDVIHIVDGMHHQYHFLALHRISSLLAAIGRLP
jgi:Protein of unknown function (DUF2009)